MIIFGWPVVNNLILNSFLVGVHQSNDYFYLLNLLINIVLPTLTFIGICIKNRWLMLLGIIYGGSFIVSLPQFFNGFTGPGVYSLVQYAYVLAYIYTTITLFNEVTKNYRRKII